MDDKAKILKTKPNNNAPGAKVMPGMKMAEKDIDTGYSDVVPSISEFISNKKISPAVFIKSIKNKKIKKFTKEDCEKASSILDKHDPDGVRILVLVSRAHLPPALKSWVWGVVNDSKIQAIGKENNMNAYEQLQALYDFLKPKKLKPKKKNNEPPLHKAKEWSLKAKNWLRIYICWLNDTKKLQPLEIVQIITPIYYDSKESKELINDPKKKKELVNNVFVRGRDKELKNIVANLISSTDRINTEKEDKLRYKSKTLELGEKLTENEEKVSSLQLELQDALIVRKENEKTIDDLKNALDQAKWQKEVELDKITAAHGEFMTECNDNLNGLKLAIEEDKPEMVKRVLNKIIDAIEGQINDE